MLDDDAIHDLLVRRIDDEGRAIGMVVGVVSPQGRRIVAHGACARGAAPVDGQTLFEIGSITKLITALLLAEAVERGELSLDDAAADRLPAGAAIPDGEGGPITLRHLAQHSAGLPPFPPGSPPFGDPAWAGYSAHQLLDSLRGYAPTRAIGAEWEYSNTGYGLLGQALAAQAGQGYEALARQRVLGPLGMARTAITLSPELAARSAQPHRFDLAPADRLCLPGLEAAGAFWSTAEDLLRFAAAALGVVETPLAGAFGRMLQRPWGPSPAGAQALGWWVWEEAPSMLIGHDGGSIGSSSSLFCDPSTRTGVVVLANSQNPVQDLARHLLRPAHPLSAAKPIAAAAAEIALSPAELDRLAGDYAVGPGMVFSVIREADGLVLQPPGAPRFNLVAESPSVLVASAIGLRATFKLGDAGPPSEVVVDFAGRSTPATRI